jgi:diguanylate cyclase (GGDEF)-like protein/PAS domain S-box-containing protein
VPIDRTSTDPDHCLLIRDDFAVIVAVEGAVEEVLGWSADELVGLSSSALLHPDDQASGVASWLAMLDQPGGTKTWRGRYRTADGAWRWIESTNTNLLQDPDAPRVLSSMSRVTAGDVSMEEELRARKQVLSRLSDALPVGLFQIDVTGQISFTNDRLHTIIDVPPAATVDAQFASVLPDDRELFECALSASLSDQRVDDIEVRFRVAPSRDGSETTTRVCLISLRSLTDEAGVVSGAIGCLSDVTDSARLRRELELRASVDALTGCLNRDATLGLLEVVLQQRSGTLHGVAVIYVDLDNFKSVNDCHGHAAGDRVLAAAARAMQLVLRSDDRVGRLGGDEFLVVCPNVTSEVAAYELTRRIRAALKSTVRVGDTSIPFRASVGLAWTNHDISCDDIVARADQEMYRSKPTRHTTHAIR